MGSAMNLEPNEVEIRTLAPGSEFLLDLGRRQLRGVLVDLSRGSATVAMENTKPPRVITTQDGRKSAPIKIPDSLVHWDLGTPVIPTGETKDIQKWIVRLKGETNMTDEKMAGTVKSKKEKRAAKAKAPKLYHTVRYEATSKSTEKKGYIDKEKTTQAAVIYRFIAAAKDAPTFADLFKALKGEVKTGTKIEGLENNFRWYLNDLKKNGYIKSIESKEEATA
jgi:hypothetical protein